MKGRLATDDVELLERLSALQCGLVRGLLTRASEAEADRTALQEARHRIKGHLQGLASFLGARALSESSPSARRALRTSVARVQAIAGVQEAFAAGGATDLARCGPDSLRHAFAEWAEELGVSLRVHFDPVPLDPRAAAHLMLIAAELVANSLTHAFPGDRRGRLLLQLRRIGSEAVLLARDNGRGLPGDFDLDHSSGLGLRLAQRLAAGLGGRLTLHCSRGVSARVVFPLELP